MILIKNSKVKKVILLFQQSSISTKLILVNISIFILQSLFYIVFWLFQKGEIVLSFMNHFYFPLNVKSLLPKWYTVITFQVLHDPKGLGHIFMNMLTLFFIAPLFKRVLSEKKIVPLYIAGGIFGAFFVLFFYMIFPALNVEANSSVLYGSSASIMAILFAATAIEPMYEVFVLNIFRIKIIYLSLFILFIEIFSITADNQGGHISHIGGAFFGYLFVSLMKKNINVLWPFEVVMDWMATYIKWPFKREKEIRLVYTKYPQSESSKDDFKQMSDQEIIDKILDKISRSGYESLSREEKNTLKSYSK